MTATDARGPKAVAIATGAGQWLKLHCRDGSTAYGVPSQCPDKAGIYYLTTARTCTCEDFRRHGLRHARVGLNGPHHLCKHILAVRLRRDLEAAF